MNFDQLLRFAVDQGASDLHLQAGSPPQLRIAGLIRGLEAPALGADELRQFVATVAPRGAAADLDRAMVGGLSFSAAVEGLARFRCRLFSHLGAPGLVLRVIPPTIRSVEELHLPPVVRDIALSRRGLTLVTGRSGSGRTATLAAMIDLINSSYYAKVITIEAPVEYLLAGKKSSVTQMEVGLDTPSFERGLAQALEQDPDVILVGDLRDAAAMRLALAAADAGYQVLAAAHGADTSQTIERILATVPPEEKTIAAAQLASSIEAVLSQRLAATRDGQRRPAVEVLRGGPYAARCILENRLADLANYLGGRQNGMQTLDQHLIELHQAGAISGTEALRLAAHPEAVATELRGLRTAAGA
jgi:twitching motility protein PilT